MNMSTSTFTSEPGAGETVRSFRRLDPMPVPTSGTEAGKAVRRNVKFCIRLTESERGFIGMLSRMACMKRSDYVRERAMSVPVLKVGPPDAGACERLMGLSDRLNPLMKLANTYPRHRPAALREALGLLDEMDERGWWPDAGKATLQVPDAYMPGPPGRNARGKGGKWLEHRGAPGRRADTVVVSEQDFTGSVRSFRPDGARAEALALMERHARDVRGLIRGGTGHGSVAAMASRSLAMRFGSGVVRVTACDVAGIAGGGGEAPAGRDLRTKAVCLATTAAEAAEIDGRRRLAGMTMGRYVRGCCLNGLRPCVPPANYRASTQFCRLASNLTQLRNYMCGTGNAEAVLKADRRVSVFRFRLMGIEIDS